MKKLVYNFLCFFMVMLASIGSTNVCALAAGGDGSGGGPGPDAPLKLEECNIYDGMENVDTDLKIVMRFTKNVADLIVQENNEEGISLKTKTGEDVEYEVYFPEEFARRQFIEINVKLEPNTEYVLSLDTTIKARNGINFLWKDYSLNFTTGDGTAENSIPEETTPSETQVDSEETTVAETTISNENNEPTEKTTINPGYYAAALVVIVFAIIIVKRRGNKNV